MTKAMIGIYDFELFPYALGDVLTWNVQTAIKCEQAGKEAVDVYICIDPQQQVFMSQRKLIDQNNAELFFYELYPAFGTHPKLQNIFIYRSRESLLDHLQDIAAKDSVNAEIVLGYVKMLAYSKLTAGVDPTVLGAGADASVPGSVELVSLFTELHSHKIINEFAATHDRIPLLQASFGSAPDIDQFIEQRASGKKIVPFHFRFRQLDLGYGGMQTYRRDASFLEWYDFLNRASQAHPEVLFIALGRLQEKPLAMLQLPNVASLRILGMGLGHELNLLERADCFIGSSSGFAAFANFSAVPYYVVRMTEESCAAYDIPVGTTKLPFAFENQELVYGQDTSELLFTLLNRGLAASAIRAKNVPETLISIPRPANERSLLGLPNASMTTSRFFVDSGQRNRELGRILLQQIHEAKQEWLTGDKNCARRIVNMIWDNFPNISVDAPQFLLPAGGLAIEFEDVQGMKASLAALLKVTAGQEKVHELFQLLKSCLDLALSDRSHRDFAYLFPHLKAKLQYANLQAPLS